MSKVSHTIMNLIFENKFDSNIDQFSHDPKSNHAQGFVQLKI